MTTASDPTGTTRSGVRPPWITIGVVVGAAVIAGLLGQALLSGIGGLAVPQTPRGVQIDTTEAQEPPPRYDRAASADERLAHYLLMLTTRDREDADWAKGQLIVAGEPGRTAVLEAAMRSLRSNTPLVQHALDILVREPRPDALPLARLALSSHDAQVVVRAAALIAAIGGPGAEDAAKDLADAAIEREYPVPLHALAALVDIGGEAGAREAIRAAANVDPEARADAFVALAEIPEADRDAVNAFLREQFDSAESPWVKLGAGEALIRGGDEHATEWLRETARTGAGGSAVSEAAARALALARDRVALGILRQWALDALDPERQARALRALRHYSLADVRMTLEEATERRFSIDTRLAAWQVLLQKDKEGVLGQIKTLLLSAGAANEDNRQVANLLLGRVPTPELTPELILACKSSRNAPEAVRAFPLLALGRTDDPRGVPLLMDVIVSDDSGYGVLSIAGRVANVLASSQDERFRTAVARALVPALERARKRGATGAGLVAMLQLSGELCDSSAAPAVEPFLTHADQPVRENAALSLGLIARPESARALRGAWWTQDEYTREALRIALERAHYRWPDDER